MPSLWYDDADLGADLGRYYPEQSVILLDRGLTQAQRRCTVSHEVIHAERGDTSCGPGRLGRRQERQVEHESARRLITIDDLVEALMWSQDERELADQLWVDVATIRVRLQSLTPEEHEEIVQRVYDEEATC